MFGQPYGTATTTTPALTFGTNTFGGSTFGNTGTMFGQPQQQQPAFGSTATFGGGAFGQPQQPTAAANPFATAGTTFGATATSFGQPAQPQPTQSTGIFGSATGGLFGQPQQPAAQTSMFGQPQQQQQSTGLFGAGSTSGNLFGQSPFGSSAGATFGAPAQPGTASMFGGTTTQAGSMFGGGTAPSGGFGSQPGTSMFGGAAAGPVGSTVKFNPLIGTDVVVKNGTQGNMQTKNYCISMMKEYDEKKSMEELRLEDYQANRKSGTGGSTALGGVFGPTQQPTTGGGLFGGNNNNFAFGSTANKPFGATTTGNIFGQPATSQPQGMFGAAPTPQTNLFGGAAVSSSPFSFGGTNTATNTFGGFGTQAQAAKPTSLFGSSAFAPAATTAATAPLFGSTTNTFGSTGGFGVGTFGQTATSQSGGLFAPKPFGTTTTTASNVFGGGFGTSTGGIFGQPKPATAAPFSFATNTSTSTFPTFGATAQPQPSLFGPPQQPKPFGSFGTNTFGQTTTAFGQPAGGNLFGQTSSTSFGAPQQAVQSAQPTGNVHAQLIEMLKSGGSDTDVLKNLYSQLPIKEAEKKPTQLSRDAINTFIANAKKNFAPAGSGRKEEATYKYYVAPSSKMDDSSSAVPNGLISWRPVGVRRDEKIRLDRAYIEKLESELNVENNAQSSQPPSMPAAKLTPMRSATYSNQKQSAVVSRNDSSSKSHPSVPLYNVRQAFDQEDSGSQNDKDFDRSTLSGAMDDRGDNEITENRAVILNRPDYYTIPPLHKLVVDEKGSCVVENFLIGRYTFGSIQFLGKTDVAGMNLDKIVEIYDKEVSVYGNEEQRPAVGAGLNKKSIVAFENIFPGESPDSLRSISTESLDSFIELLRQRVEEMETSTFIEYDPESCRLTFSVRHFSKYKLRLTQSDTKEFNKRKLSGSISDRMEGPVLKKSPLAVGLSDVSLGNLSRRSDDSSKENNALSVYERARFLSDVTGNVSMAKSDDSGVRAYFADWPETDEFQSEEVMQEKIVTPIESKEIVLACGMGEKRLTGCLTTGVNEEDICCVTELKGEILKKIAMKGAGLNVHSYAVLEQQMMLYLQNCLFSKKEGETVIVEPDTGAAFVKVFVSLSQKAVLGRRREERIEWFTWGLVAALYGQEQGLESEHDTNRNQCDQFLSWIRGVLRDLDPVPSDLRGVPAEEGPRLLFHCVLRGDMEDATRVCMHFKMYDMVSVILSLSEGSDNSRSTALTVLDDYLDKTELNEDSETSFFIKAVMLLNGNFVLVDDTNGEIQLSVFDDLSWIQCMAVSAFHGKKETSITGIWDFVALYEKNMASYSQCVAPGKSSEYPAFWYHLLQHFCRFMTGLRETVLTDSMRDAGVFDARMKWFLVRLLVVAGESFDISFERLIISNFAKYLERSPYAHLAVVAYLHLGPDKLRESEIYSMVLYALKAVEETLEQHEVVHEFLQKSLQVSPKTIAKASAVICHVRGDTLEAAYQYFESGCFDLCNGIIANYAMPLLASCDASAYHSILGKLHFLDDAVDELQPFGAFIEMLRFVADIKELVMDKETVDKLVNVIDFVELNQQAFSLPGKQGWLLEGFISRKTQEAKAYVDQFE